MSVELTNLVGAPDSLNQRFFEEVLEEALNEQCAVIKKVSIKSGSAVGDNFCSQIYRVRILFHRRQQGQNSEKLENVSVIVKSMPIAKELKFLLDLKFFLKEKIFYNRMLPRMEILLDNVKLGGKLYFSAKEPINTLVFEDLTSSDYIIADREKGLDIEHCLIVMKKLGKFHAASMALQKKDPDSMKIFHSSLLSEDCLNGSDTFLILFKSFYDAIVKLTSTWEGYESINKKLQNYANNFKQNLINTQQPIPGELKVLNHGDLWVNNLLFKYNNKTTRQSVNDVVFIDFQLSFFASPGFDLNYFFYTSMQLDVLKNNREELLRTYHTSMCDTLKAYNYANIPSFEEILIEFKRRENFGFFANFGIFPAISMDKSESSENTIENFVGTDNSEKMIKIMFSSNRLRDTMRYTLKRFDELGILDEFN